MWYPVAPETAGQEAVSVPSPRSTDTDEGVPGAPPLAPAAAGANNETKTKKAAKTQHRPNRPNLETPGLLVAVLI